LLKSYILLIYKLGIAKMQKLKKILLVLAVLTAFTSVLSVKVLAATCDITQPPQTDASGAPISCTCPTNYAHPTDNSGQKVTNVCDPIKLAVNCPSGKVDSKDPTKCQPLGSDCSGTDSAAVQKCLKNNQFIIDLNNAVKFLSAAVGIVIVIIIIIGGIQYSLAGDNANAQGEARTRITNALIALLAFLFMFAFIEWLIPGGI
jgi:hypothetical protein